MLSPAIFAEINEVLRRPRIAARLGPAGAIRFIDTIVAAATFVVPRIALRVCRDPKDDKYLDLALASAASTIVTGDQDLLALHPFRGVRIVRPAEYLTLQRT